MKLLTLLIACIITCTANANLERARVYVPTKGSSATLAVMPGGKLLIQNPRVTIEGREFLIDSQSRLATACALYGKSKVVDAYFAATEGYRESDSSGAQPSIKCSYDGHHSLGDWYLQPESDQNCPKRLSSYGDGGYPHLTARLDSNGLAMLIDSRTDATGMRDGWHRGMKDYVTALICR